MHTYDCIIVLKYRYIHHIIIHCMCVLFLIRTKVGMISTIPHKLSKEV